MLWRDNLPPSLPHSSSVFSAKYSLITSRGGWALEASRTEIHLLQTLDPSHRQRDWQKDEQSSCSYFYSLSLLLSLYVMEEMHVCIKHKSMCICRPEWLLSLRNSLSCFSKQDFSCTSLAKLTVRTEQGIYLSLPPQYWDYSHSLL